MPLDNLAGRQFGEWTVISRAENKSRLSRWLCRCACGNERVVYSANLKNGSSTSCGCKFNREYHGDGHSPEYQIWSKMIDRCTNPKRPDFPRYGGRGITVSPEWRKSFQAFLDDMGRRPSPTHSLDRRDNNGPYCKENCRWATLSEQGRNKRSNRIIEFDGQRLCLVEWAERTGIPRGSIHHRISRAGWSVKDALTTPIGSPRPSVTS